MTTLPQDEPGILHPRSPAFVYAALCGAVLCMLVLVLLSRGHSTMVSLLMFAIGAAGIIVQFRLAPPILLALVAVNEQYQQFMSDVPPVIDSIPVFRVSDVLLCAALLGYVASQYRLQSVALFVFPPEEHAGSARKRAREAKQLGRPTVPDKRAAILVTPSEVALLAVSLPFWALAAELVWHWAGQPRNVLGWDWRAAQLTIWTILLVASLTVTASLLRYWRRSRMTGEDATLMLQDILWNETRGEQRGVARWLAWFRLRSKGD